MSAAPASWNRDSLPEGDDKGTAVREMFDAIAPRYDLVNRIMTFRLDVRWRRRAVRALALPPGSRVLDLASGTGDLCVDLRRGGLRPISIDLSLGMLRADRSGAPRVQADILRLPVPDAPPTASRAGSRCATSSTSPPSSPSSAASCAPAGASPCSTSASRTTGSSAGATASTSARSCPRSARCCQRRRGLPLPPEQRRLPAAAGDDGRDRCARPGSPTPPTTQLSAAGITQLLTGTR